MDFLKTFISQKSPLSFSKKLFEKASDFIFQLEKKVSPPSSVLCCYDFHVVEKNQLKLIEVNTNASGFLILDSLREKASLSDFKNAKNDLFSSFLSEFQKNCPGKTPKKVFIVDNNPLSQKLKEEFQMYQKFFMDFGVSHCEIVDVKDLRLESDVDLIYNRSCDFLLEKPESSVLRQLLDQKMTCVTPHPATYQALAHKSLLVTWYEKWPEFHDILLPSYFLKDKHDALDNKKNWYFKPLSSYGGKGAFRGKTLSRTRFQSLDQSQFLIQKLAPPDTVEKGLKYDLRFFTYKSSVQLVGARLFRGMTPTFSQPEEGFCAVKLEN